MIVLPVYLVPKAHIKIDPSRVRVLTASKENSKTTGVLISVSLVKLVNTHLLEVPTTLLLASLARVITTLMRRACISADIVLPAQ
jgi:hypothetical protein